MAAILSRGRRNYVIIYISSYLCQSQNNFIGGQIFNCLDALNYFLCTLQAWNSSYRWHHPKDGIESVTRGRWWPYQTTAINTCTYYVGLCDCRPKCREQGSWVFIPQWVLMDIITEPCQMALIYIYIYIHIYTSLLKSLYCLNSYHPLANIAFN